MVELLVRYSNSFDLVSRLEVLTASLAESQSPDPSPRNASTRPRIRQHRLLPAQVAELIAAYQDGITVKELAEAFGIHRKTVSLLLDRAGVSHRPRGLTPPQLEQAIQLYQDGWSLVRIGEAFGVWDSTVMRALERAGIQRREPWDRG